ncbi:hypothetical protein KMZ29_21250 [Bradyrhizobium sediminis]|uniref:Uncharacterized protein n=1 Tax=Bradyrhizobium sediminis TaxID=2840469 RepID=A0A975NBT5_9BRAD|nr:hypothetical protein [Bradyrhizobium sediminis]QWG12218.1 hypothetical protein KMZ29_21250 [Bradyrhizobium sediminis]
MTPGALLTFRPTATIFDSAETVGFLRRFSEVIAVGQNAVRLDNAAALIESLIDRLAQTEQLLLEEKNESATNIESHKAAETAGGQLKSRVITLEAELAENMRQSAIDRSSFLEEVRCLSALVGRSEAALSEATAELAHLRSSLAAIGESLVLVPIASLRAARAQFESLAVGFAENGDLISQAMCGVGGCLIDRALTDGMPASTRASSDYPNLPEFITDR